MQNTFLLIIFQDAINWMSFACSSLTICKDGPIVFIKDVITHWESCINKNVYLLQTTHDETWMIFFVIYLQSHTEYVLCSYVWS